MDRYSISTKQVSMRYDQIKFIEFVIIANWNYGRMFRIVELLKLQMRSLMLKHEFCCIYRGNLTDS